MKFFTVFLALAAAASPVLAAPRVPAFGGSPSSQYGSSANGYMKTAGPSDSLYQVFPLAPHLRYVYNYHYFYYYDDGSINPQETETDTGLVEYTILDSSLVSDSIVDWKVQEVSAVWKFVTADSFAISTSGDTAYTTLQESLLGFHQITDSSNVWWFPPGDSAFQVFRYADSPSVDIGLFYSSWVPAVENQLSAADTLKFSAGEGPTYLSFFEGTGDYPAHMQQSITSATLVSPPVLGVKERPPQPESFALYQNYPNPFNPTTEIRFSVPGSESVTLQVYDILGQLVKTLVNKVEQPGSYEVQFNGSGLASGVYFYRLTAGSYSKTMKLMLLK